MNSTMSSLDDRLIWGIEPGDRLRAILTLRMEDDPVGEPVFTAGNTYAVQSVHPIADPAFVRVLDDQGVEHSLLGEHVRAWFTREAA